MADKTAFGTTNYSPEPITPSRTAVLFGAKSVASHGIAWRSAARKLLQAGKTSDNT
jgi:hypothetical protein